MNNLFLDEQVRKQALNPEQSFIVQAPAGSGKTELLIQRYLVLLANAQAPEEITAITFTRKAAAEMRERVLLALKTARQEKPSEPHRLLTWELANKVIERDQYHQWHIQDNPNRLRLLTIDALCASICARLPILSQFGAQPNIAKNATILYREAAQQLIKNLDDASYWNTALEVLLSHLDNQADTLEELLTSILASRDQWLPHIMQHHHNAQELHSLLERGLHNIAIEKMLTLKQCISSEMQTELITLASYAGDYMAQINPTHELAIFAAIKNLPAIDLQSLPMWQALATLLLTQKDQWRTKITKNEGFPSKGDPKQRIINFLQQQKNNESLRLALTECRACPPQQYSEQQWRIIEAILQVLPVLTAQLHVIFQEQSIVDFVELNLAALRALGEPDSPTDLALYLDHTVQHILIDEFQDTSVTQFRLLERLIAGWEPNDGRSIFLVGDPMQSIYRFRNAEVGLFLRAKEQGIGNVPLNFLSLKRNFRSQETIVAWINSAFSDIFPNTSNIALGAVSYTPAIAVNDSTPLSGIYYYPSLADNPIESLSIVGIISQYQLQDPNATIAILVRSRHHLEKIIPALRSANIDYQAVEIEPLAKRMEIIDILSLTKALLHLGDTIAWLAILRAPWCGLSLKDIHAISQYSRKKIIYDTLIQYPNLSAICNKNGM